MALGRAAALALPAPSSSSGATPGARGAMLLAALCRRRWLARGADVVDLGVVPTPGVASLCGQRRKAPRHRHLGLPQCLPRQRDQDLRCRGREAGRRDRERDRGGARADLARAPARGRADRPRRRRRVVTDARRARRLRRHLLESAADLARALQRRRRLRQRRGVGAGARGAARGSGASVTAIGADARRLATSTTAAGRRHPRRSSTRSSRAARTSGLPSTATRTAASPSTHRGGVVDGDRSSRCSRATRARVARSRGGIVVVTVMSNLGLHHAMRDAGITVVETPVGDRNVARGIDADRLCSAASSRGTSSFARTRDDR